MLVNKRNKSVELALPAETEHATAAAVDERSGEEPPRAITIGGGKVVLNPFAVMVVSW